MSLLYFADTRRKNIFFICLWTSLQSQHSFAYQCGGSEMFEFGSGSQFLFSFGSEFGSGFQFDKILLALFGLHKNVKPRFLGNPDPSKWLLSGSATLLKTEYNFIFFVFKLFSLSIPRFYSISTMIMQRHRIIAEDARFEPGTFPQEVWCATNEPPHIIITDEILLTNLLVSRNWIFD